MTAPNQPEVDIVTRSFTENGCTVTSIIYDPADAQQVLYGTVTRYGVLVGSYYCADRIRQQDWRIVTPPTVTPSPSTEHPSARWTKAPPSSC
jgi:hypothetical protein